MAGLTVHEFEQVWTSSDVTRLETAITPVRVQGAGSLRLTAHAGSSGVTATFTPAAPLDLDEYEELRLWTFASRAMTGVAAAPFLLEFSYVDAGDAPGEEHRWFVPVNRPRTWQQHRFAIGGDRRGEVTQFTFRVLTDAAFVIQVDELLAVRDEGLSDVESALIALLGGTAPVVFEEAPFAEVVDPAELPDPVILATLTDQREEPERTFAIPQRDSFRQRGGVTVCSVRPAPRPILAEYQLLPAASERRHSLALRTEILRRIGIDTGLRVNGTVLPVRTLLPPPMDIRVRALPAPIYLHVGARLEQGARTEVPLIRQGEVLSGPLGSGPEDQEGIVFQL